MQPNVEHEGILRSALAAFRLDAVLPGGGGALGTAVFSPGGALVLTVSQTGKARLFRVRSGALARVTRNAGVNAASFSPGGRLVVTADRDGRARLWDPRTGQVVREFRHGSRPLADASFSVDGERLVTAGDDRSARVWETGTGRLISILHHHAPVLRTSLSPDGTARSPMSAAFRSAQSEHGSTTRVTAGWSAWCPRRASLPPPSVRTASSSSRRAPTRPHGCGMRRVELCDMSFRTKTMSSAPRSPLTEEAADCEPRRDRWPVGRRHRSPNHPFHRRHQFGQECRLQPGRQARRGSEAGPDGPDLQHERRPPKGGAPRTPRRRDRCALQPDGRRVRRRARTGQRASGTLGTEDQFEVVGRHEVRSSARGSAPMAVSSSPRAKTARPVFGTGRGVGSFGSCATEARSWRLRSARTGTLCDRERDRTAGIWSVATGRELHVLRNGGPVGAVDFSPNGRLLVTGSDDSTAGIWSSGRLAGSCTSSETAARSMPLTSARTASWSQRR